MYRSSVSLIALTLLATPALAEDAQVDGVVVTATRRPTAAEEVGSAVTVFTADDIARRQQRTLPDVLQLSPGLNVVQTGGPGGRASVFIRGANANHTKVLIDGVDANDPSQGGVFDFGAILTDDIARVEVLRGPQSGLYGSDAIGGVVNIVTAPPGGPNRLRARLEAGSFETFDQALGAAGEAGPLGYAVNLAHARTGESSTTPLALIPNGRAVDADEYENTTLTARLRARASDRLEFNGVARLADSELFFTSDEGFPSAPAAERSRQDARGLVARAEARLDVIPDRLAARAGVNVTDYRTKITSPGGFVSRNAGDELKGDLRLDLAFDGGHTLIAGLEAERERLADTAPNYETENLAVFAEAQTRPGAPVSLTASVRLDDNDRFGGKATWRLAAAHTLPATGTILRASYGTGFKAPTLTQLFVSFPEFFFFANPDLEPETSRGFDLSLEQPLGDRLTIGATYFDQTIRNLITTNATFDSYANIGRARAKGVEAFAQAALTPALNVRLDYTYTDAEDRDTGLTLLRRPKHRATAAADWAVTDALTVSATVVHVGRWIDGDRSFTVPRLKAPDYTVAHLAAQYRLSDRVTVFGRVENLTDERYENPVGFERPGRGAFAGLRVSLD
ncbi:TonB-dependent receptor [Phenylobacterium sp. J426]|uniref:TonB-dependent receptor plug domain-containing protein n=1 Tax=Phenylobacterium sp. J426 TaxID=2898439 RepID=UPI002151DEB6|nr:TonB-dependent receptor [Phenylobacterium sp. J426]MCR5875021.1 TonB-dependent receptor [Phenylobacterium sp. J426]